MGAFGKEGKQVDAMAGGTYRQMAMTQVGQTRPGRGGGGGGGGGMPTFVDRFKPSTGEDDLIRLVAGCFPVVSAVDKDNTITRNLPFMTFTEHFDGQTNQSCTCSAGPFGNFKGQREPCRGCDMFWEIKKDDGKPGARMSKRDMFAFSIIHYAPFAHVPQLDYRTKQPRLNDQGKPFMEWKRVLKHERAQYDGYEQKTAHRLHWPMGSAHYGVLWEYDDQIGNSCATCNARDVISSVAWVCGNTECGEEIIDCETTTMPPEEVKKITTSPQTTCSRCHAQGFLQEMITCKNCSPIGNAPRRATLFDVDMRVKRKPATDGGNQTTLLVTGWTEPRPIDPQYAELAKPLALDKIYAPTSWDLQVRKFGPGTAPAGQPARTPVTTGSTPYGNR